METTILNWSWTKKQERKINKKYGFNEILNMNKLKAFVTHATKNYKKCTQNAKI